MYVSKKERKKARFELGRVTYRAYSDMLEEESSLSYWLANWSWGERGADMADSGENMFVNVKRYR